MARFVRTTGGLLQLEERQVTQADYDRVARFYTGLRPADAAKAAAPGNPPAAPGAGHGQAAASRARPIQVPAAPRPRRPDLQAAVPAVFLRK